MINRQEIFNIVKTKALKQNKKCGIMYENGEFEPKLFHNGLKCNIGFLINPESDYHPSFEDETVCKEGTLGKYFLTKGYSEGDLEFLQELQDVHDSWEVDEWDIGFRSKAAIYGLEYDSNNK